MTKEEAAKLSDFYKSPERNEADAFDLELAEGAVDRHLSETPFMKTAAKVLIEDWIEKRLSDRDNGRERARRRLETLIDGTDSRSRQVLYRVKAYLIKALGEARSRGEDIPVDIVVDLSLIPEKDIRENMETWAYLMLLCMELENVNFIFKMPDIWDFSFKSVFGRTHLLDPLNGKGTPRALAKDVRDAAQEADVLDMLEKQLRAKARQLGLSPDVRKFMRERVNAERRSGAVEVPIFSKAWFEWARENDVEIKPDQYPVTMEGNMSGGDNAVLLRNFEAALTVGLSKAALVIAQRRDSGKKENEEKELPPLRKEILKRLQELYNVLREDVMLSEDTLNNMIHTSPDVRMNLAISLYLPRMTKMAVKGLMMFHDSIQLALHAA